MKKKEPKTWIKITAFSLSIIVGFRWLFCLVSYSIYKLYTSPGSLLDKMSAHNLAFSIGGFFGIAGAIICGFIVFMLLRKREKKAYIIIICILVIMLFTPLPSLPDLELLITTEGV